MGGNIGIQRDKLGSPDSDLAQDLDQLADLDQDEFDGPLGTVNGKYIFIISSKYQKSSSVSHFLFFILYVFLKEIFLTGLKISSKIKINQW